MQRYLGALNFREHVRSTMTECGSFVISGSEDCQAYVWNTDTGQSELLLLEGNGRGWNEGLTAVARAKA